MKKIVLAATLLVALTASVFAGGKNSNVQLLNNLKNAFKSFSQVTWQTTETYKKSSFTFDGKSVHIYLNAEDDALIGFTIQLGVNDLPQNTMENIEKKFAGWQVTDVILFIDADGNATYYAQVDNGKKSLALQISDKGKPSIYAHMPH